LTAGEAIRAGAFLFVKGWPDEGWV
jgi:hypothetical protein